VQRLVPGCSFVTVVVGGKSGLGRVWESILMQRHGGLRRDPKA